MDFTTIQAMYPFLRNSLLIFCLALPFLGWAEERVLIKENPRRAVLQPGGSFCQDLGAKGVVDRMVDVARAEWEAFDRPIYDIAARLPTDMPPELNEPEMVTFETPQVAPRLMRSGLKEDFSKIRQRIGSYWTVVPEQKGLAGKDYLAKQNKIWAIAPHAGWVDAWSAAFISYVMCEAGVVEEDFVRSASHIHYVQQVVAGESENWRALSLKEAGRLKKGDIVCADRGGKPHMNMTTILEQEWRPLHCDIVVGHGQGNRVKLIGGNVKDAVTMTVVRLEKVGKGWQLEETEHRRWFTVLRQR